MIYIVIVGLFIISFFTLNILYKRTNHYINSVEQVQKFISGVPHELEMINMGSSYAKFAFDYSHTQLKGFNFGLQPQSLSYDFKILKQYKSHLKKDCIVLITLPNLVFGFLDYENDNANSKYYYFLNKENILNYSAIKYFIRINFPILSSIRNLKYLLLDVKKDISFEQTHTILSEEQVTKEALSRVEGWKQQFRLNSTVTCDFSEDLKMMFAETTTLVREMIDFCLENGFKPVLLTPPTSKIINQMMSKEFMQECLYNNINESNKQGIPVLDYLYDERFEDFQLYINSDFLNKTGREQFSKVVMDDLKKIGLIRRN